MKGIEGLITFTYYEDIEKAATFYRETLGFEEVMIDALRLTGEPTIELPLTLLSIFHKPRFLTRGG